MVGARSKQGSVMSDSNDRIKDKDFQEAMNALGRRLSRIRRTGTAMPDYTCEKIDDLTIIKRVRQKETAE